MQEPTQPNPLNSENTMPQPAGDRGSGAESFGEPFNESLNELSSLEVAKGEIELLREQIRSLQQELHDRTTALSATERQLELMNWEIQQVLRAMPCDLREAREAAQMLVAEGLSPDEALTELLSFIYRETVLLHERSQSEPLSLPEFLGSYPLMRESYLSLKRNSEAERIRTKALKHQLNQQYAALQSHLTQLTSNFYKLAGGVETRQQGIAEIDRSTD